MGFSERAACSAELPNSTALFGSVDLQFTTAFGGALPNSGYRHGQLRVVWWWAMKRQARLAFAAGALAVASLVPSGPLAAQSDGGPVLHEYLQPDPVEDIALGSKTSHGDMPAAIETESGAIGAPTERPPSDAESAYGAPASESSADASYRLDSDTTRPDVVSYDDPFTPQIPPYKRLYAFDTVNRDLELVVSDERLQTVDVGGRPNAEDDQFYADMQVDLSEDGTVRVPSVGPGARALALYAIPSRELELKRDSAENWFLRSSRGGRVRVIMHLAVDRGVFGGAFADVPWDALTPYVPTVPLSVQRAARALAEQLEFADAEGPKQALDKLVHYFRSFAPSEERPQSGGLNLYRDIVLQQKGVCRHRSYAFMVTALGLGIPTRFVHNEAHAWVEVFDGHLWHRIDLGGAAGRLEMDAEAEVQHVVPRDPYEWPAGSQSGLGMPRGPRQGSGGSTPGVQGALDQAPPDAPGATPSPQDSSLAEPPLDLEPPATAVANTQASRVVRGARVAVSGRAERNRQACRFSRVDIELLAPDVGSIPIGTLVTDQDGHYQGSLAIPPAIVPGKYELTARVPSGACLTQLR